MGTCSALYIYIYILYPTPLLELDMTEGQFLRKILTGLNSKFFCSYISCYSKVKELYLLVTAGGRIVGFIPFRRVWVPCEMKTASSRIWTWVTYNSMYFTMNASNMILFKSLIFPLYTPWVMVVITFVQSEKQFFNDQWKRTRVALNWNI